MKYLCVGGPYDGRRVKVTATPLNGSIVQLPALEEPYRGCTTFRDPNLEPTHVEYRFVMDASRVNAILVYDRISYTAVISRLIEYYRP